ncbi:BTAD domain-containing putative transcriptional regulator [Actinoplanes sp. NPDC051411]|uniref:AfsR/SARP family transcriptional regulator n=1 Tax=Actinoplanes sp. NPDC051411 TaxID=3155522 RepID=UPI0034160F5A
MTVRFGLLGDVVADLDGHPVDLGHARQRCVLVALLVDANRTVTVDQLIDRVWADRPPRRARDTLYGYLHRLRRALADSTDVDISRTPGGYQLAADGPVTDLHRFGQLVRQARADDDERNAYATFDDALRLWRGDAFADLGSLDTPWLDGQRRTLHRQRFAVELEHTDLALRLGRHGELLDCLATRAAAHPLDERVAGQLMLALYRCGRQADALEHYQALRRRLAEELGTDPGPEAQALHQQILTAAVSVAAPGIRPGSDPAGAVLPHQLPAPVAHLVGRCHELATLTARVEAASSAGIPAVMSVGGTAGVGKTALVVHWAHQFRDRFPDGQLYVDLRGFDPGGQVMDPAEAVRGFLDALGVPPHRIPQNAQSQIALYRSLLDGKRILLLLDNARDAQQVRPLLPGSAGAVAVVTSRNLLSGLVAVDGAHPVRLDLLTDDAARQLLRSRLGAARVDAEPDAARQIIASCARLPLALTIVAARAAQTGFPLRVLAAELAEAGRRLDALCADDPASEVRAVFSWSYVALSSAAARLFRLLGLHPGPEVATAAAAGLAGLPAPRARVLLAELTRASLLTEHAPGRFAFHDLLRAYAIDRARGTDSDQERHTAEHRMLDHYLHSAHAAARLLAPARDLVALPAPRPGVDPEHPADHKAALVWFTAEHAALMAAVHHAAAGGFDAHTWQLAGTLDTFLDRRGHWHDLAVIGHAAVAAANRLTDPAGQAVARRILARAQLRLGHFDDARTRLGEALDLFSRLGDLAGQADTHLDLARVAVRQGAAALAGALHHVRQAQALHAVTGHRLGQAQTLNAVGWSHARLGDYPQALRCCLEALPLLRELDDCEGQTFAWDTLGYAHHHLGEQAEAVSCYRQALDLCRELGDRYLETGILTWLGDAHRAAHEPKAARDAWRHALDILTELGHPDAGEVRVRLAALD